MPWIDLQLQHGLSNWEAPHVEVSLASRLADLSWRHVKRLYDKSVWAYRNLKGVVEKDLDHVSRLLSELDPLQQTEDHLRMEGRIPQGSPSMFAPQSLLSSDSMDSGRRQRKRRRSSTHQQALFVIRPLDPFAPTIIITPCPPQSRETSCWVPYQDTSFGARLTVPTHIALNSVHPPRVVPMNTTADIRIDNWEYARGHWRAVIPLPDEQCRRGMFSKSLWRRARFPRTNSVL